MQSTKSHIRKPYSFSGILTNVILFFNKVKNSSIALATVLFFNVIKGEKNELKNREVVRFGYIKSSFQKVLFTWLLNISFLVFGFQVIAQQSAVQVTTQFIPPYSLKLSDYNTAANEKLFVQLLLTDITEVNRSVRLKMYIEGRGVAVQSVDFPLGETPLFLDGGFPLRLSNIDLGHLFKLENLQGISPDAYNKPLPEGLYQFCFEVYDALTNVRLSQKSCTPIYLVQNEPPLLNLPNLGEIVTQKEIQNIVFQWTPRHLNATNVEYEFTLKELWDNYADSQAAFLSSAVLYQTTSFTPTLLYGEGEPQLLPNKRYAWQVRAISKTGASENAVFKNNGYSEIFHFIYTADCNVPQFLLSEAQSITKVKVMWQADADQTKFNIQYRKKDVKNAVWFNRPVQNTQEANLYSLQADTWYEFRVGSSCISDFTGNELLYTYSEIQEFKTPKKGENSSYNCGFVPNIEITNVNLLESLYIKEMFTAGDFPVTAISIDAEEGVGSFTGLGYIVVPYLADKRIEVSFTNIKINTDRQLIEGVVLTTFDTDWSDFTDNTLTVEDEEETSDETENDTTEEDTTDEDGTSDTDDKDDDDKDDDDKDDDKDDKDDKDEDDTTEDTDTGGGPPSTDDASEGTDTPDGETPDTNNTVLTYLGVEFNDGDIVKTPYDSKQTNFTFFLKDYPEKATFNWQVFELVGTEVTRYVAKGERTLDHLEMSLSSGNYKSFVIIANYNDKSISVTFEREAEFKLKKLTASLANNGARKASNGQILYLVKSSKRRRKIDYKVQIDPNIDQNLIADEAIAWNYDLQESETDHRETDFGEKEIQRDLKKSNQIVKTTVRAGNPNVEGKGVEVKWVKRNHIKQSLKFTEENDYKVIINTIKKIANKLGLPIYPDRESYNKESGFSVFLSVAHTIDSENKEDKKSRLVYREKKKKLSIKTGIKGALEVPIPDLAIPPVDIKILGVGMKFELGIYFYIEGSAYGELGVTEYDLDYIEEKKERNKNYTKVGDPSEIQISAEIGLDPKAVFSVVDFEAKLSGRVGVRATIYKIDFQPGGRSYSPLFEEGFDLICEPVASIKYNGKWEYSLPVGKYRYQVRWE